MGYLFLLIAIFAGSAKGYCGKTISGKVQTLKGTFFMNFIRMALCIVVGFFFVVPEGMSAFKTDLPNLLITLLSGFCTAMFVVTWIMSVRKGAYVMLDVFLMLGVGVTIALCKVFFDENITTNQYIGFALLLVASYIMCSYSSSVKNKFTLKSFGILVLCGVFNGITDFSQKLFVYTNPDGSAAMFNFYTYVFSSLILFAFFAVANIKEKSENDGKSKRVLCYIVVMAVCLFANSFFKTLAAKEISSATLYPLSTGAALIMSVVMAGFLFKEKITPKCIIGVVIAFIGIITINL